MHRKGEDDARTLAVRGRIWDRTLGHLFPADRAVRVLDGACGNGAMVAWLTSRGYSQVTGVDISQEVVSDGQRATLRKGMAAYLYRGAVVGIWQRGKKPLSVILSYPNGND